MQGLAPTINGKVDTIHNLNEVRAMPGVTDVVSIASGIAVRAETFSQCIDAVNASR
jgi:isoquinoline 1-oxidoreductase beta subunit